MSQWDEDLEHGRRVAFWQRVYLQTLGILRAHPPASYTVARSFSITAAEDATEAVGRLEAWLATTQPAQAPTARRNEDPEADDDSDGGGYLGR